jgi:hypothetical protein
MMVLEPDTLSSKRDTDGRPIPRPDPLVRKDKHLSVFKLVTFRKSRWLAMLAGCVAVVWMAGNTLRQPASAQPGEQQVSTPRQMSPAVAAQPPQKEELKTWFLEDIQTEVNVTRGKLLQ